jgi:hypothetical protein
MVVTSTLSAGCSLHGCARKTATRLVFDDLCSFGLSDAFPGSIAESVVHAFVARDGALSNHIRICRASGKLPISVAQPSNEL